VWRADVGRLPGAGQRLMSSGALTVSTRRLYLCMERAGASGARRAPVGRGDRRAPEGQQAVAAAPACLASPRAFGESGRHRSTRPIVLPARMHAPLCDTLGPPLSPSLSPPIAEWGLFLCPPPDVSLHSRVAYHTLFALGPSFDRRVATYDVTISKVCACSVLVF
jgi:hypothetical protein